MYIKQINIMTVQDKIVYDDAVESTFKLCHGYTMFHYLIQCIVISYAPSNVFLISILNYSNQIKPQKILTQKYVNQYPTIPLDTKEGATLDPKHMGANRVDLNSFFI